MRKFDILLVEDEKDIRDLIRFQLSSEGHFVHEADSVDMAFLLIDAIKNVDLFIIDWMLPGIMSGLEFTKNLRKQKKFLNTPVIIITALTQPDLLTSLFFRRELGSSFEISKIIGR